MAQEEAGEEMMAAERPVARVMRKSIPRALSITDPGLGLTQLSNGWELVTTTAGDEIVVYQTELDLSGYAADDLTFFPGTVQIQQSMGDHHTAGPSVTTAAVHCWDLVTLQPVSRAQLLDWTLAGSTASANVPGFLSSDHALQGIVYGRFRRYHQSSTIGEILPLLEENSFGLLTETVGEKLYLTRIYRPFVGTNGFVNIQSSAFVVSGVTMKEPDLVYLERMRRTYVLQGS